MGAKKDKIMHNERNCNHFDGKEQYCRMKYRGDSAFVWFCIVV